MDTAKPVRSEDLRRQFMDRLEKLNAHDQMYAVSDRAGKTAYVPSSIALLGRGVLGMAGLLRKRYMDG